MTKKTKNDSDGEMIPGLSPEAQQRLGPILKSPEHTFAIISVDETGIARWTRSNDISAAKLRADELADQMPSAWQICVLDIRTREIVYERDI